MEKIIKVLEHWSAYEKTHPQSEFEDFCRYYLSRPEARKYKPPKSQGPTPPDANGLFMMAVTRTTLAFFVYMRIALKDSPMPSIDSLMICAALNNLGESRKTDIINHAMVEISTGVDIINRLIKKNFIHQRVDPDDKRSKLLTLSASGKKALFQCFARSNIAREILLTGLTEDDKKLVTQILLPVQAKHTKLSVENKQKTIEEIRDMVVRSKGQK